VEASPARCPSAPTTHTRSRTRSVPSPARRPDRPGHGSWANRSGSCRAWKRPRSSRPGRRSRTTGTGSGSGCPTRCRSSCWAAGRRTAIRRPQGPRCSRAPARSRRPATRPAASPASGPRRYRSRSWRWRRRASGDRCRAASKPGSGRCRPEPGRSRRPRRHSRTTGSGTWQGCLSRSPSTPSAAGRRRRSRRQPAGRRSRAGGPGSDSARTRFRAGEGVRMLQQDLGRFGVGSREVPPMHSGRGRVATDQDDPGMIGRLRGGRRSP